MVAVLNKLDLFLNNLLSQAACYPKGYTTLYRWLFGLTNYLQLKRLKTMKKINYLAAIAFAVCCSATSLKAQSEISNIFKAGITDLNTVANGYLRPAGNSWAAGLGSNWYSTAEVHKTFGFDISIGASAVMSPGSERTFDISGLTNLKPTIAGTTTAPTFSGSGSGVELNLMQPHYLSDGKTVNPLWNNGTGKIVSFTTPKGVSKYVPVPNIQFTIGLPIINDLSIRWTPSTTISDAKISSWGVGVKHNIKQWIPGVKLLPFDASVLVGYTHMNVKYAFSTSSQITPDKLVSGNLDYIADPNLNDYSTQGMAMTAKAFTAGLVISKKLLFFTPYIGVGLVKTNFDLDMVGNYPTLGDPVPSGNTYKMQIKNVSDPIKVTGAETMANATLGFRLKFGLVSFNAQYVAQKYATASAGLGISFR